VAGTGDREHLYHHRDWRDGGGEFFSQRLHLYRWDKLRKYQNKEPDEEEKAVVERLDGSDFDYELREAAVFWNRLPWELRALPPQRLAELMGHRREKNLRESHASHVQRLVAKEKEEKGEHRTSNAKHRTSK